jgi:hypothetical protein
MERPDKPVFYIHIGIPKTATTTIQLFLTMHRDVLLQRGVLYPRSIANSDGHSELHRVLSVALEPESIPSLAGLRKDTDPEKVIASLFEEISRTQSKIVILSAESLAFMRRPETLRRALAPYSARILVYLRRQDNFLASFYNQLIKSRLYTATFEEFLQQHAKDSIDVREYRRSLIMCDYEAFLKRWANAFGHENILAGAYEDYDLPAGILHDVAAKTGIDIGGLRPPDADPNPALTLSIVSLKRRVNALLSSEEERIFSERLFTDCKESWDSSPLNDEEVSANMARRRTILASYQEGNAHVAREYFSGRPGLFDAPNKHDSPLPDFLETNWLDSRHGSAIEMIARLIADLSRLKNKQA